MEFVTNKSCHTLSKSIRGITADCRFRDGKNVYKISFIYFFKRTILFYDRWIFTSDTEETCNQDLCTGC